MCATCGCEPHHDHGHGPSHEHAHRHDHAHPHAHGPVLTLEQKILAKNDAVAQSNRAWLAGRGAVAVNLLSSPGSGKTTLLERTIRELRAERRLAVIEGDQQTDLDARRIRAAGAAAVQINTGAGCHLDASMIERVLPELELEGGLLLIENVGNLVCPALFDLGENARVVVASVTEGAEKPAKYPAMFRSADLVLLNKIDLLPHVPFRSKAFEEHLRLVNPRAPLLPVSAATGEGLEKWREWLRRLEPND